MKIVTVVGARPQFVKEAIVQAEIKKHKDIEEIVIHTGQHYDENMSGIFFDILNMDKPEYNLGINGKTHGEMTGQMLMEIEKILMEEKPDVVILYGDTDSTLAGALAASKLKIKVAHIEAGLRQEPKDMPEETNRVLTDRISSFLFVPSETGISNLKKEGLTENVYFTGDVMYDIYLEMEPHFDDSLIEEYGLEKNNYLVMTMHRDFNVDEPEKLKAILEQVQKVSKEIKIIWPLHPRTANRIKSFGYEDYLKDILIIEPTDYLKLMGLTKHCYKTITDSGGYQKESYFADKEAVIIMPDTSWRELTDAGINVLVEPNEIYDAVMRKSEGTFKKGIYGDGTAAKQIIEIIKSAK